MRTAHLVVLLSALAFPLVAPPAFAHGGIYKGPPDASGGGASNGGTVGPPTNPKGSAAPGPGASAGSSSSSSGASTNRGDHVRGRSDRRGPTTSGESLDVVKGQDSWEFWWESNKDAFLQLKSHLASNTTLSGSVSALSGRGNLKSQSRSRRPDKMRIRADILPVLLDLVRQSDDRDLLDSAILALGRTTTDEDADAVIDAAMPLLAHPELSVQSSAALALGVLGSTKAAPALQSLLQDSSEGQRLTGGGSVHWLVRAFAALSLGLIGDAASTAALQDAVDRLRDSDTDIKVCAIVALGMCQEPQAEEVAAYLVGLLDDKRMDPLIASYIPTSLGKLGPHDAVAPLVRVFTSRDSDNLLVQSAAIGLGQLATVEDEAAVKALLDGVREGRDQQARHFALIALGQIGARDPSPAAHQEVHDMLYKQLGKELRGDGRSKDHRSWAALAAAIYGRADESRQVALIERIEAAYEKESNPSYKGAFAVALGLLDDDSFGEQIQDDFDESREDDFRGYAAVALGLMDHQEVGDALRGLCQAKGTAPTLRLQAATGLGLLGDTRAVETLIGTLGSARTLGVSSAVAKALGLLGDQDSIDPLKALALDEAAQEITRAFACVALGIVGEKTDLPWNTRIRANNNYRAKTPAMAEVLDIL